MTVNRESEASLKSSVNDPQKIPFSGLECDVVNVWNDRSIDVLARKAINVAFAVENDARVFEPDVFVCCCESAVVPLIPVQNVNDVVW